MDAKFDSGQALLIMTWVMIIIIFALVIMFFRRVSKNKYDNFYERGGNIITDKNVVKKKIDEIKNGPLVQER